MCCLDLNCTFANLLTRAALRVALIPRLPFVQLAVNWARHDLAVSLLNFVTCTISTTMVLLSLDCTLTLSLTRSTFLGALAPTFPLSPLAIHWARINVTFSKLHQWSITDLAIV
jgi:hypothetical protein